MTDSQFYDYSEILLIKSMAHLLNEGRKLNNLTDVELDVGGKLFPAHRAVISLYSPVFKAAVSDQWSTTKICPISDEYIDADIMEDLLNFLYTGKIKLTPENAHPVCVAAHFLQIPMLIDVSAKYLGKLITVENVFTLFEFSINCQLKPLCVSCSRFVQASHQTLFQDSRILQLSARIFKELIVGLKKLPGGPAFRKSTFHCIVRWIENNLTERSIDLPVLLKNIPLEELPREFIDQTVSTHELVVQVPACAQMFNKASIAQQALQMFINASKAAQKAQKHFIFIEGKENSRAHSSMTIYDSEGQVLSKLPNMSKPRQEFSAAVINQQDIIVCGGYTNWASCRTTDSVEMFDWDSQTWKELFKLPDQLGRVSPLMAVHENHLYVAGGEIDGCYHSDAALCFSFETLRWEYVKSMNNGRSKGHLIAHKKHLYALGLGSNRIERYDPKRDEWTVITTKKLPLGLTATLYQDKIYICGLNSFLVYDLKTADWTTLPELEFFSDGSSLVSINDKLLVVGGSATSSAGPEDYSIVIYEFDFTTMQWKKINPIGDVLGLYCCVVGDFS